MKRSVIILATLNIVLGHLGGCSNPLIKSSPPSKVFNIKYELGGGSNHSDNPKIYTVDSETISLKNPVRPGYSFLGWHESADFSGSLVTQIPKGSSGDKTLWARWLVAYTITYNLDGGTNHADNPVSFTVETADIILGKPTKIDYAFDGWYDNSGFTGYPVKVILCGSQGSKTLWAKWTHGSLCEIDYRDFEHADGGEFLQESLLYPPHTVPEKYESYSHSVSPFKIAKYMVTYELWYTVREWAESTDRGDKIYSFACKGSAGANDPYDSGAMPSDNNRFLPASGLSWRDAIIWCNAYSEMEELEPCYTFEGKVLRESTNISSITDVDKSICNWDASGYRLPTEGEWQYAASYIDGKEWTPYNYASGASADYTNDGACDEVAWYQFNSGGITHPVGQKKPNSLGLFDMNGNVWEWVWDLFAPYPDSYYDNYRGPSQPGNDNGQRILKGGGRERDSSPYCQLGLRYKCSANVSGNSLALGIRLCRK